MKKSEYSYKKLESPTITELHQLAIALNSDNPNEENIKGATSIIARTHKKNKASLAFHKESGFVCETDDYIEDSGKKNDKIEWQLRLFLLHKTI